MAECEAAVPAGGVYGDVTGWFICGQPATERYRYGCIHEHVNERWTCPEHRPEPGSIGCRACAEAGHPCDMTFEQVT